MFDLWKNLSLDIFGEYSYDKFHFPNSKKATQGYIVQAGGLTFGDRLAHLF
jgi:hypothetical protein